VGISQGPPKIEPLSELPSPSYERPLIHPVDLPVTSCYPGRRRSRVFRQDMPHGPKAAFPQLLDQLVAANEQTGFFGGGRFVDNRGGQLGFRIGCQSAGGLILAREPSFQPLAEGRIAVATNIPESADWTTSSVRRFHQLGCYWMLSVTLFDPMFIVFRFRGIMAVGIMAHKISDQHIFPVALGFMACQNFKCVSTAPVTRNEVR
jgi:hypothetical protein